MLRVPYCPVSPVSGSAAKAGYIDEPPNQRPVDDTFHVPPPSVSSLLVESITILAIDKEIEGNQSSVRKKTCLHCDSVNFDRHHLVGKQI